MDVFGAMEARRTVHMYEKSEIDESKIRRALEMALLAPNHKFSFPWKFVSVGSETREKLKSIAKSIKMAKKNLSAEEETALDQKLICKMTNPAALVVFCLAQTEDDFRQREDYATVSCSIQNFTLALAADGYGTKWGTGDLTRSPKVYQLLKLDRKQFEIVGFLWVGHSSVALPPQKRPSLAQHLEILP